MAAAFFAFASGLLAFLIAFSKKQPEGSKAAVVGEFQKRLEDQGVKRTRGRKGNKSQAVREELEKHGGAKSSPSEVVKAVAARGITVTSQMVSVIKSRQYSGRGKAIVKRTRRAAAPAVASNSAVADLFMTQEIGERIGLGNLKTFVNRL